MCAQLESQLTTGASAQPNYLSHASAAAVSYKKCELMLTRRAKAYSSSGSVV